MARARMRSGRGCRDLQDELISACAALLRTWRRRLWHSMLVPCNHVLCYTEQQEAGAQYDLPLL